MIADYGSRLSQIQTVSTEAAVDIRTEEAATRVARPYMLAKI